MANAFAVVGCIVALILAVSILVAAVGYLGHCRAESRWQRDQVTRKDAKRDIGARMATLCHWFSEDVAAWKAIQIIGLEIQRGGDFDISACRERWRQEVRDAIKAEEEPSHV